MRKCFCLPFGIFCFAISLQAESLSLPHERTFHDPNGRPLLAKLLNVQEDRVFLERTADGAQFWVPMDKLSEDDQVWVTNNFSATPAAITPEKLIWPDRAEPEEPVKIEIVEETFKDKVFIYASQHFQYEAPGRLTRTLVRDFAEVFEATYAAVMTMPLPWNKVPPKEPMRVRIFATMADYIAAGGLPNSAGVYVYRDHICMVPVSSLGLVATSTGFRKEGDVDIQILLHEVTHQVMHNWRIPIWLNEGMAEYMERMPYSNGTIYFRRFDAKKVVQSEKNRIHEYGLVHPDSLLKMTHREWNAGFHSGDLQALYRNYQSAFVLTAFFLELDDDESSNLLRDFVDGLQNPGEQSVDLTKHSSDLDLETRLFRALRSMGIQARFYD